MRVVPTVNTAKAGSNYVPLPAHPAPKEGAVARLEVTAAAVAAHTVGGRSTLVMILVEDASVRFLQGEAGDPADDGMTLVPGYHSFSVDPAATLRFQAVTGTASVEVLEG
jgi:hypothetical protein